MSKLVNFKNNILAHAVATCTLAGMSMSTLAQSTTDADTNSVAGYHGSLQRSMEAKRDAVGVIEVISSESPGEVSDSNLAETLQRISGVAVSRMNGEASRVTVRGIDQELNLVTVNDRKMPTVSNNYYQAEPTRGFDFDNLSGEGVKRVDVYKTGRADLSAGGLGTTIDVKTLRPFDIDGTRATANVKAATDTSHIHGIGDKYTPEASSLLSWTNNEKTLGATFAGSYQRRDFALEKTKQSTPVNFPNINTNYQNGDASRVRENTQITLQYRPINNLTTTLDFLNLNNDIDTYLDILSVYGNGDSAPPDIANEKSLNEARAKTTSTGLNIGYEVNSEFTLAMDYHDSTANGGDKQYSAGGSFSAPEISPTFFSGSSTLELQESNIKQFRLDGHYHLGNLGFLSNTTINLGIESRDDTSDYKQFSGYSVSGSATQLDEALRMARSLSLSKGRNTTVEEEINGGFIQVTSALTIVDMPAHFSAGVRAEKTDVTSSGGVRPHPSMITQADDGEFGLLNSAEPYDYIQTASYTNSLPNLDFDLAITNTVKTRLSLSKTIARAPYGNLKPDASIQPYQMIANAEGNPELKPLESKNFDIAVEWYYQESSFAALGYFRKDLSNLIGTGTQIKEFYGLRDMRLAANYQERVADARMRGVTMISEPTDPIAQFNTFLPVNNRETKIDGLEFTLEHIFGESGFGVSTNYTKVNAQDTSKYVFKPLERQGTNDFANLMAFYEKNAWQAQVAYNWRDNYLDGIYNSGAKYVADSTQIDFSLGYNVNKNLTVTMEALNITSENQRQYGGGTTLVEELSNFGARYKFGAHFLF